MMSVKESMHNPSAGEAVVISDCALRPSVSLPA